MDIQKIFDNYSGQEDSPDCVYHVDIAKHLAVSIGDTLSLEDCLALMWILERYEIQYSDGLIINAPTPDAGFYILGGGAAAMIAAAFCREMCAVGLRQAYGRDLNKKFLGKPVEVLLATIRSDPAVLSIS